MGSGGKGVASTCRRVVINLTKLKKAAIFSNGFEEMLRQLYRF
jgi:hypothetical protein